ASITLVLGDRAGADRAFESARMLYEAAARERPQDPGARGGLAQCLANLARLHGEAGRTADAEACFGRARAILSRLAAESPDRAAFRDDLANLENSLGAYYSERGRRDEAVTAWRRGRDLLEPLAHDHPSARTGRVLARLCNNLAVELGNRGQLDEATACFRRAIELPEDLLRADPRDFETRAELAASCTNQAILANSLGDLGARRRLQDQALGVLEGAVQDNPDVVELRRSLALLLNNIGGYRVDEGRPSEALAA